tara:strand:+ start:24957 stop:25535 length:579 start_codon:yes stop_codon:yes gene_type:complete
MKTKIQIALFVLTTLFTVSLNAQEKKSTTIKADSVIIDFHAGTPLEDIDAKSTDAKGIIKLSTGEFAFVVSNRSFHFKRSLMEEHFNENYMESDKYKVSTYKGKIVDYDKLDLSKDGTYKVVTKGILNIHGVEQEREIEGEIIVKDGKIHIVSTFMVKLEEHKIKIPKVVTEKIAEEVKVNVNAYFDTNNLR